MERVSKFKPKPKVFAITEEGLKEETEEETNDE
jgi:hypothetical protein